MANGIRDLPEDKPASKASTAEFKLLDKRENDVTLGTEDGRAFTATVKEGVEGLRRGSRVAITSDGTDETGIPKNAVVTRAL